MSQAIPISNPKNNLPDSPVVSPGILGWLLPHWWSASTPSAVPSEGTGPDPSLFESVIEDNWEYVFDDKEKFEQLKYKLEKESRLRELEEIAKRKSVIKLSNEWRGFIRQFLESLPAIEYSFASNALDSSSRYSIIGEIVKQFQDSWLGALSEIYWRQHLSRSTEERQQWQKFKESFFEKTYEKNVIGNLRDFAFFCYQGSGQSGVTPKILEDIITCWINMLSTALTSPMGRELRADEVHVIEEEVTKAIEPLIRMHIQTSKNCHKSLSREGELPRKWSEEKLKETVRLSEIRSRGADARYDAQEPRITTVDHKSSESFEQIKQFLAGQIGNKLNNARFPINTRV
jgi:hypothetical protein